MYWHFSYFTTCLVSNLKLEQSIFYEASKIYTRMNFIQKFIFILFYIWLIKLHLSMFNLHCGFLRQTVEAKVWLFISHVIINIILRLLLERREFAIYFNFEICFTEGNPASCNSFIYRQWKGKEAFHLHCFYITINGFRMMVQIYAFYSWIFIAYQSVLFRASSRIWTSCSQSAKKVFIDYFQIYFRLWMNYGLKI